MRPTVSFVIPSKNCVHYLPLAVGSALEQDYQSIEVVIVDDASTDKTKQYTDWITAKDSRVRCILTEGIGRSEARNAGNMAATGAYILVLDADDEALKERARLSVQKLAAGADFVYGGAYIIDSINRQIGEIHAALIDKEKAFREMKNGICHSTVAYSRKFADKFPYTPGEIADLGIDDWEQQVRAISAGVKMDVIPAHISAWRQTAGGISFTRNDSKVTAFKEKYLAALKVAA